jgi:L-threonylcarbamoyladenylate synthase
MAPNTLLRPYGTAAIAEAAALIRDGVPVAVPTETVYGLAADATNGEAVARIYAAKGRPDFNPLIVHVLDPAAAERLAIFDQATRALAAAHWPGPLTLVLPRRRDNGIASIVTAGRDSIAIRVPAHRAMRALLSATATPLAAPSANASGTISPTRAAHVLRTLDGRIAMIIDDGPCAIGLESTIIASGPAGLRLLRAGPLTIDAATANDSHSIESPGQLDRHYAPSKPLRLDAADAAPDEWLIGFGSVQGNASLSPSANLVEAAAALFDCLHAAEVSASARIAVAPVPPQGLGAAINDRLSRAAAR